MFPKNIFVKIKKVLSGFFGETSGGDEKRSGYVQYVSVISANVPCILTRCPSLAAFKYELSCSSLLFCRREKKNYFAIERKWSKIFKSSNLLYDRPHYDFDKNVDTKNANSSNPCHCVKICICNFSLILWIEIFKMFY